MSSTRSRWQVRCQRPVAYDIIPVSGLFEPGNATLIASGRIEGARRFVVVDANVARFHGERIQAYFAHYGIKTRIVVFPGGEENKTVERYLETARELDGFPIHRRDEPIIAIGGGVLTDLVGFLASSYRRGIPHIRVPTTLMGYVDAAVGAKTGINFGVSKNRLGSFEPPRQVLLDRHFLETLPRRHILNGVGEIIKLAVIKDRTLFEILEREGAASVRRHFQDEAGTLILDRSITGMLEELEPNLFEDNLARSMDFGHTFSYGLETRHGDRLLHGEAVLLDVLASVLIAARRGLLDEGSVERIFRLVDHLGIAFDAALLDVEGMWQALLDRVEHRNGEQRVPMPDALGRCIFVHDVTREEIAAAVESLKLRAGTRNELILEC